MSALHPYLLTSFFPALCTPEVVLEWLEQRDASWLWVQREGKGGVWNEVLAPHHLLLPGWDRLWDRLLGDPFARSMLHQNHMNHMSVLLHEPRGPALTNLRERLGKEGCRVWWQQAAQKNNQPRGKVGLNGDERKINPSFFSQHIVSLLEPAMRWHTRRTSDDYNEHMELRDAFEKQQLQRFFDTIEDLVHWEGLNLNDPMTHAFKQGGRDDDDDIHTYQSTGSIGAILAVLAYDPKLFFIYLDKEKVMQWFLHAQRLGWMPHPLLDLFESAGRADYLLGLGEDSEEILSQLQTALTPVFRKMELEKGLPTTDAEAPTLARL